MQIKQMYAFDIEIMPVLSRKHLCRRDGTARLPSLPRAHLKPQSREQQHQPEVTLEEHPNNSKTNLFFLFEIG